MAEKQVRLPGKSQMARITSDTLWAHHGISSLSAHCCGKISTGFACSKIAAKLIINQKKPDGTLCRPVFSSCPWDLFRNNF